MNAKLFIAVGVVLAVPTTAVFIFGIRIAALVIWVVVVGTGLAYGRREAARQGRPRSA